MVLFRIVLRHLLVLHGCISYLSFGAAILWHLRGSSLSVPTDVSVHPEGHGHACHKAVRMVSNLSQMKVPPDMQIKTEVGIDPIQFYWQLSCAPSEKGCGGTFPVNR